MSLFRVRLDLAAALLVAMSCNAFAEDAPLAPPAQADVGTYCGTGVASVTRELNQQLRVAGGGQNRPPLPDITTLYARCQPGDIIAVSASEIGGIGSMCDFNKTVVWSANTVLCVYVGVRALRP